MIALLKFISALISYFNCNRIVTAMIPILIISCKSNQSEIASKAKSLEAQQELRMVHNLEYAYLLQYAKYSPDLEELNYPPHKLLNEGGTALYEISIVEASVDSYKAQAQAVQDFNGDGQYNIWEIDQEGTLKEIQPD